MPDGFGISISNDECALVSAAMHDEFFSKFGNEKFVAVYRACGEDDYGYEVEDESVKHFDAEEVWAEITSNYGHNHRWGWVERISLSTLADIHGQMMEQEDIVHFCTEAQWEQEQAEKNRKRHQSYREEMREDGLCIGMGVTAEQWYDEYNADAIQQTDEAEEVEEVLAWVRSNCPLLWCQWEESQLANAKGD
jgi:hypothetical protein